jgi:hypothetical protein
MRSLLQFFITLCVVASAFGQNPNRGDCGSILSKTLGHSASVQPGDVFKVGLPRTDLHVRVGQVEIKPALALGGWLAFKETNHGVMVMGDLVLTEDEVALITAKLQATGLQQTAIHNHLLHESPRVVYMHVVGHGECSQLATSLRDALAVTKLPAAAPPSPQTTAELTGLNQVQLEQALGRKGKVNGGVLQFSVPRAETITDNGMEIPPAMGTATAINFQPTGNGNAAITGDFALLSTEVNPVIAVLNENGISVTALHSHMLTESPRLFFMHFWADSNAMKLASALHDALAKTNSASAKP